MGIIGIVGKGDFSIFRPLERVVGRIIGVAEGEVWPFSKKGRREHGIPQNETKKIESSF